MNNSKYNLKLLDLFCGAGGAAQGYFKAGFDITGVDIKYQPNYPFKFYQEDATKFSIEDFDLIHASPPCQKFTKAKYLSKARNNGIYKNHPDYIDIIRKRFICFKKFYVIENVPGSNLINPLKLYGSQFKNLYTQRERHFESNVKLIEPKKSKKAMQTPSAGNGFGPDGSISICGSGGVRGMNSKQIKLYWGFALGGIDWMTREEMAESIPPAYTEFIGKQLIEFLTKEGRE